MGNMKDWTGVRQGRITVLGYAGEWRWKCKCDCGTVFETGAQSLRQGILSCGCMHKEEMSARLTKDETGKRYGRLTVLRRFSSPGVGNFVKWLCKCDCGAAEAGRLGVAVVGSLGRVKGKKGSVLVAREIKYNNDRQEYEVADWACALVDGEKIKEDMWYVLKDGKLVEEEK